MNNAFDEMRKALIKAHESDPESFWFIVGEIKEQEKPQVHPRARTKRLTKRTKAVAQNVWAKVEFLRWRDGDSVVSACKRLEHHGGFDFDQYDTEDNKWRPATEPKPDSFHYSLKDWQGIRGAYYDYWKNEGNSESFGEIRLGEMKAAHKGESSIFDPDWLKKYLPPEK